MHLLIVRAKSQNRNKNRKRMEEAPAEQQVEQCCFAGVLYVLGESIKLTNEIHGMSYLYNVYECKWISDSESHL